MVPGSPAPLRLFGGERTAKEGVATTTSPQPLTAAMSVVSFSSSGRGTPLSMGFSRVSRRTADSLLQVGPQGHVVAVFQAVRAQGRPPGAAAKEL